MWTLCMRRGVASRAVRVTASLRTLARSCTSASSPPLCQRRSALTSASTTLQWASPWAASPPPASHRWSHSAALRKQPCCPLLPPSSRLRLDAFPHLHIQRSILCSCRSLIHRPRPALRKSTPPPWQPWPLRLPPCRHPQQRLRPIRPLVRLPPLLQHQRAVRVPACPGPSPVPVVLVRARCWATEGRLRRLLPLRLCFNRWPTALHTTRSCSSGSAAHSLMQRPPLR